MLKVLRPSIWRRSRRITLGVQAAVVDSQRGVLLIRHGYRPGWQGLVYGLLMLPWGIFTFTVAVVAWTVAWTAVTLPLWGWISDPPPAFTITLRSGCIPSGPSATEPLALTCTAGAALFVPPGESPNGACDARTGAPLALPVTVGVQNIAIHVPAGSEIDSGLAALGLITVTCPPQAPGCRRRGIT